MKAWFEAWLVGVAIMILKGRNVTRSMVVSRKDNNAMWGMCDELEDIRKRIKCGYQD